MTHIDDGVLIIREEATQRCNLCGKIAEVRPYGPNGEDVCFKCGMKDEESVKRQFNKRFHAAPKGFIIR